MSARLARVHFFCKQMSALKGAANAPPDRQLDLRALPKTLNDAGVHFIGIGGVAVGAHGYVRATDDLDSFPIPTVGTSPA